MFLELVMGPVMVTFYRRFFECPVHPFHLTVGPWVIWLGKPMLDSIHKADAIEDMPAYSLCGNSCAVFGQVGKSKYRCLSVRYGFDRVL